MFGIALTQKFDSQLKNEKTLSNIQILIESHKQIVNRNQTIVSISETSLLYSRVRSDRNQLSNSANAGSANNSNSNANNSANLGGTSNDNASGSGRGGSSSNPGMKITEI